jgi:hypothetical protein
MSAFSDVLERGGSELCLADSAIKIMPHQSPLTAA